MTRRLDGYRRSTAGVLLYLVAFASVSPLLFATTPARADFREVGMVDDDFEPPEIIIQRGDTIVWVHRGVRPHGVRATDGSFESSPGCSFQNGEACMRNGERYSRTFDQAGTYAYYCPVHGSANGVGMAGQITVASGGSSGGSTTAAPSTTQTTRSGGTTVRPPTTRNSTTQAPGTPTSQTTSPPSGSSSAPTATGETAPGSATTIVTVPSQNPDASTSTLAIGTGPVDGGPDDGNADLLIGIAAAVVLAAAISAMAWYYRPANRHPGGPPPPISPA